RWIPHDARNPVLVAAGWVRCFGAPVDGRVDGVPVRLRSPYRLRHQYVVDPRSYEPRAGLPRESDVLTARGAESSQIRHAHGSGAGLSDVQSLLAATTNRR
ncbi:MAG TPA: hypothetical protein VFR22_09460, partial [Nocardioidaceae bacterium]|nr:hypothetical protein [Nocardioidaceae bacterium]